MERVEGGHLSTLVDSIRKAPKKFDPRRKLKSLDEFLLMLMKLRLNLLNTDLARRFNLSKSLCGQIFHSWLAASYKVLGKF